MFNFLTEKDYKIINSKFADLWEELQGLKRRVKALEDENEECTPISELRASDMVMAYNEKFGWVKACVMETYGKLAFVVGDGKFWFADKVRKIDD